MEVPAPRGYTLTRYDEVRMDQEPVPRSPGIAIMFQVVGFVFVLAGVVAFIISVSSGDSSSLGIGAEVAVCSLFPFAASAIITRLHRIEHHLRPRADEPRAAPPDRTDRVG